MKHCVFVPLWQGPSNPEQHTIASLLSFGKSSQPIVGVIIFEICWKLHREYRSMPFPLTGRLNRSAVEFDDVPRNSQA